MDKYVITLGDFLKNAGIVGFRYMLEAADVKRRFRLWHYARRTRIMD